MTFLDFFAGIGGFRLGLEQSGHTCIGHCEIDKYANKAYYAMHEVREDEWFEEDITKVKSERIPGADMWTFGFPCQDISLSGKRKGIDGARSGLFFKVIELLKSKRKEDKPRILLIENVKNLLSINSGWDFARVLIALDEAGYDAEWQVLNSSWWVPQHRERIFIIGYIRGSSRPEVFPFQGKSPKALKQIVGGAQGQRIYDSEGLSRTISSQGGGQGGRTGLYLIGTSKNEIKIRREANCIPACYYKGLNSNQMRPGVMYARAVLTPERINKRQNGRRFKEVDEPMFTLTTKDIHGVAIKIRDNTKKGYTEAHVGDTINISFPDSQTRRGRVGKSIARTLDTQCMQSVFTEDLRIRRLTPRECFRLQGFTDEYFDRAQSARISDSQLYKCAGNGVTVDVIREIGKYLQ